MKCPYCAEVIRDDATKCRYCHEVLTKADKMGYPRFYEIVASWGGGLRYEALLMDYSEHFGIDLYDSCLLAGNPMACILINPGNKAERDKIMALQRAIMKRGEQIDQTSQEAHVLKVIIRIRGGTFCPS